MENYLTGNDIKNLREKLGVTQKDFAKAIGSSKPTVERWEMNRDGKITGPVVALVTMLQDNTSLFDKYLTVTPKSLPKRMWYMHKNSRCTLIDVDDSKRIIQIKNYKSSPMFRAFGVNEHPSYEDYLAFLEERCVPKNRDKIKIYLDSIGVPFYDPYLIIQKSKGRMAEDNFWIDIEES